MAQVMYASPAWWGYTRANDQEKLERLVGRLKRHGFITKEDMDIFQLASKAHSFIHSGHFYSAPSSPLPLRGAPDYSTDTVSEFHAEAHTQLHLKNLPNLPTYPL